MKRIFLSIIISLTLCFFLSTMNSLAGQVNLAWDPPDSATDVTGYRLDYGTDSGSYSQGVDVGNTQSYTVSNLSDGQTFYFAVLAYNQAGDQSGYSNEVSKTVPISQYLLVIGEDGTGTGTVSGTRISCGATCLAAYDAGTLVSLSAAANPGSVFAGWSGGGCSGTGSCKVTMNAATTIKATFNKTNVTYTIAASVTGKGKISPSGTSSVIYGGSKAYSIIPNIGYRIATVTVDGKAIGAVSGYTFSNIVAKHKIVAAFIK
jgi:hypothetical protein